MVLRRPSPGLLVVAALIVVLAGCSAKTPASEEATAAQAGTTAARASTEATAATGPTAATASATEGGAKTPAVAPAPQAGVGTGLPAGVSDPPAATAQLVTVMAAAPTATTAILRAWERQPDGSWRATTAPLKVRVGTDGVGRASESSRRTPAGSYTLDQAFGRATDPGTKLPYRHVSNDDWWVSDTHSPAYNTYRHCRIGTCTFDESAGENLGQAGTSYDYALVIGYNTLKPIAGAGSAFFLHVDAGVASAGCVEVPRATVLSLLRWLDPGRHPRITITTG